MQRQHSSQATSTLGNTPNLNIGFLHQKENPTIAGLIYTCEKHIWTALNSSTCNGMLLGKAHEEIQISSLCMRVHIELCAGDY